MSFIYRNILNEISRNDSDPWPKGYNLPRLRYTTPRPRSDFPRNRLECTHGILLVSTPAEVGLPYEEINLTTSDDVKLRAYVLVQKRDLKGARTIRTSASTDAEVSAHPLVSFVASQSHSPLI